MSKKIITSCIKLLCVILICTIFTGCAAKNTNNINIDDQPYWNVFNHYITKGENGYYFISHNYLYFMQDNGKGIILCNNASCIHDSEECLAYLSINYNSQQLYYYNNKLYVMYNDFKESNSCYLIEIAADGSERKRLFEIGEASVKYGLTFHDNCVYIYTRQGGVSGFKENTATIRARSLDGKKDKIIHSYTGMGATIYALKSYGDKMYFLQEEQIRDEKNQSASAVFKRQGLYSYDYNKNKIEKEFDGELCDYAIDIDNHIIYYYVYNDGLYKKDLSKGDTGKLYEYEDGQTNICQVSCDSSYVYLSNEMFYAAYHLNPKEYDLYVLDKSGKLLNTIPTDAALCTYFGDDIYMFSSGHEREDEQEKFRYIKKSEILSTKKWTYVDWIQYAPNLYKITL